MVVKSFYRICPIAEIQCYSNNNVSYDNVDLVIFRYVWGEDSVATQLPHQAHQPPQEGTPKTQQTSILPHHTDRLWTLNIKMEVSETLSNFWLTLIRRYAGRYRASSSGPSKGEGRGRG